VSRYNRQATVSFRHTPSALEERAFIADKIATLKVGRPNGVIAPAGAIESAAQEEAAKMLNIGRRSVQRARVVREKGAPELQQAVRNGAVSLTAARAFNVSENLRRRHLDESQQSMVAARLANLPQGTRTDLSPKGGMLLSQPEAAALCGTSKRMVQRAAVVLSIAGRRSR
jgi:hypothetical protein